MTYYGAPSGFQVRHMDGGDSGNPSGPPDWTNRYNLGGYTDGNILRVRPGVVHSVIFEDVDRATPGNFPNILIHDEDDLDSTSAADLAKLGSGFTVLALEPIGTASQGSVAVPVNHFFRRGIWVTFTNTGNQARIAVVYKSYALDPYKNFIQRR